MFNAGSSEEVSVLNPARKMAVRPMRGLNNRLGDQIHATVETIVFILTFAVLGMVIADVFLGYQLPFDLI